MLEWLQHWLPFTAVLVPAALSLIFVAHAAVSGSTKSAVRAVAWAALSALAYWIVSLFPP